MIEMLTKKLTKNYQDVPLFYVSFNLEKFQEKGESGSCTVNLHPSLQEDAELVEKLKDVIDHIRKHHDMVGLI